MNLKLILSPTSKIRYYLREPNIKFYCTEFKILLFLGFLLILHFDYF